MSKKRTPYRKDDLRYRKRKIEPNPNIKAVWIEVMDTSGSMGSGSSTIKDSLSLTRAFNDYCVRWLKQQYPFVELVFIAHDAEAREEPYKKFIRRVGSGGTHFSSGYELALKVIQERFPPDEFNIYVAHSTDGDNEHGDTPKALQLIEELCKIANLVCFLEVRPGGRIVDDAYRKVSELSPKYPNLKTFFITQKSDVRAAVESFVKED